MSEQDTLQPRPKTEEEYRTAVDQVLADIWRLNEQMGADREDIIRLRAENDLLKRETRRVLASMGLEI